MKEFFFDQNVIAVTGKNGLGKTNLLDSIYYACLGKSYFSSSDKMVVKKGEEFFRIEAIYEDVDGRRKVIIKVQPSKLKEIESEGFKLERLSDHIGEYPVVMIAPSDIQTLLEGSEERRTFLNNCIVQYDKKYLHHLQYYTKLLKQRNALLKDFAERNYFDHVLLSAITSKMVVPAHDIFEARKRFIDDALSDFLLSYNSISSGSEEVNLLYKSELHNQDFLSLMDANVSKDKILHRTSSGVHKDDITFLINGDHLESYASQGQIKSFILALKLAQFYSYSRVKGLKPILLLDDIFDKLDACRVEQLLKLVIDEGFGQVFITDTHVDRIPSILKDIHPNFDLVSYT